MESKLCTKCGAIKPLDCFQRRRNRPSGYQSRCRTCVRKQDNARHSKNRERRNEAARRRYSNNPIKSILYSREWRLRNPGKVQAQYVRRRKKRKLLKPPSLRDSGVKLCKKCGLVRAIDYFGLRKERPSGRRSICKWCESRRNRSWQVNNRERVNEGARRSYWKNPKRSILYSRKWRLRNPEKRRAQHVRERERRKLDLNCRILARLRRRVHLALKGEWKSGRTIELLGCGIADFKIYLESRFEPGMSWQNYGRTGWHIDHIMPCAIFDLRRPEHQKRCFHFSNMQPMWAHRNLKKASKLRSNQFDLL
jgi:ribosomal protein S20